MPYTNVTSGWIDTLSGNVSFLIPRQLGFVSCVSFFPCMETLQFAVAPTYFYRFGQDLLIFSSSFDELFSHKIHVSIQIHSAIDFIKLKD